MRDNRRKGHRVVPIILAAVIIAAVLCAGAYAAYTRWFLPGTQYASDDDGVYEDVSESNYTTEDAAVEHSGEIVTEPSEEVETATEVPSELSDSYFITQAVDVLELLGLDDAYTESMALTRSSNEIYGREEAAVLFERGENNTSVKFNADTGMLINLSGIEWIGSTDTPCETDEQAEAVAMDYYKLLPVTQGYVLTRGMKHYEQYWSYEFCREVSPGLYNEYEMVRLAINPENSRLTSCNVFYYPLLDDHSESDEQLTQAQAEAVVLELETVNLDVHTLVSAEIAIILPIKLLTADLQYSDVSKLAWSLIYEDTSGVIASIIQIDIDLYTGEMLGRSIS